MAELMQPNIVGNFLNAYQSGLERQEAQKEAERQRMRQDRADQMSEQRFGMEMDANQLQRAIEISNMIDTTLASIQPGDEAGFEAAKQRLALPFEQGGLNIPLARMANKKVSDIPSLREQTGVAKKQFELRLLQAQIGTEEEQRRAARALATQRYAAASGGGGGNTILNTAAQRAQLAKTMGIDINTPAGTSYVLTGQLPSSPAGKLTETQSKDLAFYERGKAALNKLDADRAASMSSLYNSTIGQAPFGIGNYFQTQSSRQGKQAAADFLAAILRKDSGAALTQSDFDIYGTIFIPQFGDDTGTLQQKAESRKKALEALRLGLGSAEVLASAGAPSQPASTAPPQGAANTLPNIPPPPPGARILR
jgi:hypothetical protein